MYRSLFSVLGVLFALGLATCAHAQGLDFSHLNDDLCNVSCENAFTIGLGLPTLGFGVADIAYATHGEWLPRGLAYAQLSFGLSTTLVGALGLTDAHADARFAMLLATGAALSLDALLSVMWYRPDERALRSRAGLGVALVPLPHGLLAGVRGRL
jgi:hypothetical protein